jgi:alpha-1,6-mannosyltransferase
MVQTLIASMNPVRSGPVSRTFIGAFIVSLMTFPWTLVPVVASDKLYLQVIARVNLGILVVGGFNAFANAVGRKYGTTTRRALVVLTLTQFHFLFYLSRPLPNTFALSLTLWAISRWVLRDFKSFIFLIAVTVVIFRFETCLLFGWILLYEVFVMKDLTITSILKIGIPSGLVALVVTVLFDSFFWGRWVWPEGDGLYLNVYQNKSHEWGTYPFLWYFYSAVPRAMLCTVFFVPFATKKCIKNFLILPLLFILTYSLLPHKELRFIMYVIPLLNVCAANTVAIMVEKFEGTRPCPESYLGNKILKMLGQDVVSDDEAEAADRERDHREREEEELRQRRKANVKPPAQYDAIVPSPCTRQKRSTRNGMEAQLDESYSRITAAVLEKHRGPGDLSPSSKYDVDEEPAALSCMFVFVFILMGIHIWCNVGFTLYASYAAWNNYPGGEAVSALNSHIRSVDLKEMRFRRRDVGVYVTNLAAQTGVTRFAEMDHVVYDKSPSFEHVANRTIFLKKGRGFSKYVTHDFSQMKVVYPILEKVDVPFLQMYCVSATATTASKGKKTSNSGGIENVVCNFGENARNCKILKVVNQFTGVEYVHTKNVVFKTTPVLWIFRCQKSGSVAHS